MKKQRIQTDRSPAARLRLLDFLGSDQREAERKYALLRRKLIKFMELRHAPVPADLADAAMERVAVGLDQGFSLRPGDPYPFFCSVAITLLKAATGEKAGANNERGPGCQATRIDRGADRHEQRVQCLDCCLKSLVENERHLILEYYWAHGKAGMERRRRLAEQLGIPMTVLRIRAWRIREELEHRVNVCLDSQRHD